MHTKHSRIEQSSGAKRNKTKNILSFLSKQMCSARHFGSFISIAPDKIHNEKKSVSKPMDEIVEG